MIQNCDQKEFIEFKCIGELFGDLPDTVYKLEEYWRTVVIRMFILSVSDTLRKLMTETNPFLFDENFKTFKSSVVWVE